MIIIRGRENIEERSSVAPPTSGEVNAKVHDWCKGFIPAYYTHSRGWVICHRCETLDEAAAVLEDHKALCYEFPEVFNWFDVSDMVILRDNGCDPRNPSYIRWYVCAMVVEE